jgi:hypothetical protein
MLRLAAAGRTAGLSGATAEVLAAVITLLPQRWSRVRDHRVRLAQLIELCPSKPHLRTVGRALRTLDGLEIVHYIAACGRGTTATIAVHERLLTGIEELPRDDHGVVVPFSAPYSSLSQGEKNLNTGTQKQASNDAAAPRPTGVNVERSEIQAVMDHLPEAYRHLPRNLDWLLRREITGTLQRGHLPAAILQILEAPAPAAGVARPYKLAVWRLAVNMAGPGPRLLPLQRRWERNQRLNQERQRLAVLAEDHRRIERVTTAHQREALAAAMQQLVGPAEDPRTAVLTAVRRACRQYPELPTAAAVQAWLEHGDQRLTPPPSAVTPTSAQPRSALGLNWITGGDRSACVGCGQPGVLRPELPLPTVACDRCLANAADVDDADADADEQRWATAS